MAARRELPYQLKCSEWEMSRHDRHEYELKGLDRHVVTVSSLGLPQLPAMPFAGFACQFP